VIRRLFYFKTEKRWNKASRGFLSHVCMHVEAFGLIGSSRIRFNVYYIYMYVSLRERGREASSADNQACACECVRDQNLSNVNLCFYVNK